jgi:AcrR family transcriptional regulator
MGRYQKGEMSRAGILDEARKLLNEKGIGIGVELIARDLGLSRGRITHFFPTKDSLMVSIMRDYEHRLGELLRQFDWNQGSEFGQLFSVLDIILDLQYEYRSAFFFLTSLGKNQPEIHDHIEASFFNRVDGIYMRIKMMVGAKLLETRILGKEQLDIFLFQYINILTTWVICQEMYYRRSGFKKMKPVYIMGAMELFLPYLTIKGRKAYQAAATDFNAKYLNKTRKTGKT